MSASAIVTDLIPDDTYRGIARSYSIFNFNFWTNAPAIYHNPVKVQALCGNVTASSYQYRIPSLDGSDHCDSLQLGLVKTMLRSSAFRWW
ncbi:hypothetical protein Plhal304r1_c011g0043641 [Plasmopara halstedii]